MTSARRNEGGGLSCWKPGRGVSVAVDRRRGGGTILWVVARRHNGEGYRGHHCFEIWPENILSKGHLVSGGPDEVPMDQTTHPPHRYIPLCQGERA